MKLYVLFLFCSWTVYSQDITLTLEAPEGAEYAVVGNVAPLNWQAPLAMTKRGNVWSLNVALENSSGTLEYRYLQIGKGQTFFEPITGSRDVALQGTRNIEDTWGERELSNPATLTPSQLQQELELLAKYIDQSNELMRHKAIIPLQDLESELSNAASSSDPLAYFFQVARIVNYYTAGAVNLRLESQSKLLQRSILEQGNKLPFEFSLAEGRMIVTQSLFPKQLPIGAEILKINQKFVWQVLELFEYRNGGEGSRNLNHDKEFYDMFLPQVLPPLAMGYVVTYQGVKKPKTEYLPATSLPKRRLNLGNGEPLSPKPSGFSRNMQSDKIAYLNLKQTRGGSLPTNWQNYLTQSLQIFEKNKVPNLIVDLRDTSPENIVLLKFLAQQFGVDMLKTQQSRYQLTPFSTDDSSHVTAGQNENRPMVNSYSGAVWLLYGEGAGRGLGLFLSSMSENKNMVSIGQTFNANTQSLASGETISMRLPFSNLEMALPKSAWVNPEQSPQSVLDFKPRIQSKTRVTDITQQKDGELLRLIGHITNAEPN